jgi:hypothetical protein
MKRTYILLFFHLLLSSFLLGQNVTSAPCLVHRDKTFYVCGEIIWFSLHLPAQVQPQSFNVRVAVLNPQGKLLESFFLATKGKNQVQGYYKIPFQASSGVYQLQFSAMESALKQPVLLAEVLMPIYSDLESLDPVALNNTVQENPAGTGINKLEDLQVEITLDKANYRSRETVQARVQVKDRQGRPVAADLSIAVTDWNLAGTTALNESTLTYGKSLPSTTLSNQVYTQVKLQSEVGNLSQNLIGIFFPQNWQLLYTSSKQEQYLVEVPSFQGSRSVQFLGHPQPNIQVQIQNPLPATQASPALVYTPGIRQYLEWSRMRKKIYQLYSSLEMSLPAAPLVKDSIPLEPDRSFRTAEYEAFEDMATLFKELLTPLSFKQDRKTGLYSAKMYDPTNFTDYPGTPIFIIDGKVTRNADFVARLKTGQVERIDMYYYPNKLFKQFKAIGRSGVTYLHSKAEISIPADEAADVFQLNGLQIPLPFPTWSAEQLRQMPSQGMFRPQVYWNAQVRSDANGQASFSFVQTDDWSSFQIQVLAQGADGQRGLGTKVYVVEGK